MSRRAFICGLSGLSLTARESAFLAETRPAGIIVFSRNVEDPEQVGRLISEARRAASAAETFLVLVDQEGGRVQRLSTPHWRRLPPARAFGEAYRLDRERGKAAAKDCALLTAQDLYALGFNTACAPVLDVPIPGADNVIGDRAFGEEPTAVTDLGAAVAEGLLAGGILPVIKHIPGHGRALADSHFKLPAVNTPLEELKSRDFEPFRALRSLPIAMTAHVVFTAIDPSAPVTTSKLAIERAIRDYIGFDGLLMSDDLSMNALSGSLEERTKASFRAGCDVVLHCNGRLAEMAAVAARSPILSGAGRDRFEAAYSRLQKPQPFNVELAEKALMETLAAFG